LKLYVGNLAYKTTKDDLQKAFEEFGPREVIVVTDKFSGQSRGFGFVDFADDAAAHKALNAMDGYELDGRNLKVNEARPPENRPRNDRGGDRGGRRRDRD
jgi:RNA recognition motif-containing protein